MNQLYFVFLTKLRICFHQLLSVRKESKIKLSVISFFSSALLVGIFFIIKGLNSKLIKFVGYEYAFEVMGYLLAALFLFLFMLLIFSNILVSYSTLFNSREVKYFFSNPLSYKKIFILRYVETFLFSSWALAFFGLPAIIAFGRSFNVTTYFYFFCFLIFVPFVIIPSAIGSIITMFLVRVFPLQKIKTLLAIGAVVLFLFTLYVRSVFLRAKVSSDILLIGFLQDLHNTRSSFLPSFWASQGLINASLSNYREAFLNLALLIGFSAIMLFIAIGVANYFYYRGWTGLLGIDKLRIKLQEKSFFKILKPLDFLIKNPYRAFILKDIKLFWRDPSQWTQFVIFFGIIGVYYAYLGSIFYYKQIGFLGRHMGIINVGLISLILSTLTSRFFFPSISLEGKRFWVLGIAPVGLKKLIWVKFWLCFFSTSLFTVFLIILSGIMLGLGFKDFASSVYIISINGLALSGIATGLGALYPNFEEDNISRIVSGLGGTLNFLISSIYVVLITLFSFEYFQIYIFRKLGLLHFFNIREIVVMFAITILAMTCIFVPMFLGRKNLVKIEI